MTVAADLIFHYEQNSNYQILHSKLVICFSVAQWQSIWELWGPNGSVGVAVSGCTALWYWIQMSTVIFLYFGHFKDLNGQ